MVVVVEDQESGACSIGPSVEAEALECWLVAQVVPDEGAGDAAFA